MWQSRNYSKNSQVWKTLFCVKHKLTRTCPQHMISQASSYLDTWATCETTCSKASKRLMCFSSSLSQRNHTISRSSANLARFRLCKTSKLKFWLISWASTTQSTRLRHAVLLTILEHRLCRSRVRKLWRWTCLGLVKKLSGIFKRIQTLFCRAQISTSNKTRKTNFFSRSQAVSKLTSLPSVWMDTAHWSWVC